MQAMPYIYYHHSPLSLYYYIFLHTKKRKSFSFKIKKIILYTRNYIVLSFDLWIIVYILL